MFNLVKVEQTEGTCSLLYPQVHFEFRSESPKQSKEVRARELKIKVNRNLFVSCFILQVKKD